MASEGPLSPVAGNSVAPGTAWSNPGNITAEDGSVASVTLMPMLASEELWATQFGFSIPGTATIDGIVAEIKKSGTALAIADSQVKLIDGAVVTGDDQSAGGTWPTTLAYTTYGGVSDTWGVSLAPANVNNDDFGVMIVAVSSGGGTANVDHVRMTVYYTDADTGGKCSVTVVRQPYHPAMFEE